MKDHQERAPTLNRRSKTLVYEFYLRGHGIWEKREVGRDQAKDLIHNTMVVPTHQSGALQNWRRPLMSIECSVIPRAIVYEDSS